jgi:hypothetical protein
MEFVLIVLQAIDLTLHTPYLNNKAIIHPDNLNLLNALVFKTVNVFDREKLWNIFVKEATSKSLSEEDIYPKKCLFMKLNLIMIHLTMFTGKILVSIWEQLYPWTYYTPLEKLESEKMISKIHLFIEPLIGEHLHTRINTEINNFLFLQRHCPISQQFSITNSSTKRL